MNNLLEVQAIAKRFDSAQEYLWKDVSFSLKPGTTISICGQSGSGKSTLLFALGGLTSIQAGRILFQGQPVICTQHPPKDIGFIFQHYHLIQELNVEENILLPNFQHAVLEKDRWRTLIEALQLAPLLKRLPVHLSGGERQRVAIARALITCPKLLLADEPTGSLDEKTGAQVMNLFFYVCKTLNTSCILVTHNMLFAQQTDQQFYLEKGLLSHAKS